ncbi:MAG: AAA family ATPase [Acholeplasma sp.]|nr:AAA family ATPase [Acholeplasma sp.]
MKIQINGYKNIESLTYEIEDKKLNILIGVSGSGKSSIIGALKQEDYDFNKKINYMGNISALVDGNVIDQKDISVFSELSINRYLFDDTKDENIFDVVVDDDNKYVKARKSLNLFVNDIYAELESCKSTYEMLSAIQKQLGGTLTKTYKLKSTSTISKMMTSINSLSNKKTYKKIASMNPELAEWIVKGEPFIINSLCPYCGKKLSSIKEKELHEFKHIDIKNYEKINLSPEQLKNMNSSGIKLTQLGLNKLQKDVISIGIALIEYEKLKNDIEQLFDTDLQISKFSGFNYSSELYLYFPTLKQKIKKMNGQLNKLKSVVSNALNDTKLILSRKLNTINELLKSFGIPYEVSAKYKNSKIEGYKLYHVHDSSQNDRIKALSSGEKKVISLIFFILEQLKKQPKLIIFDDPVSSYDENRRFSIFKYILSSLKGNSVLILSHDQSFAKYACNSRSRSLGNIDYFENYLNNAKLTPIIKTDFDNLSNYIENQIINSTNYFQKIINLRFYYEINRTQPEYSYLSAIIHQDNMVNWFSKKQVTEDILLMKISKKFNITLNKFSLSEYLNIDTTQFSIIEKAFLLREKTINSTLKDELSNYIHLNSMFAITLNPYSFSFCSNFVYEEINKKILKNLNYNISI